MGLGKTRQLHSRFTQHRIVVCYWCLETTYWSHLQRSSFSVCQMFSC